MSVEFTRTFSLSLFVCSLPWKITVLTPRRFLPAIRRVPPAWTRALPEHSETHRTPEISGSGV